MFERFNYNTRGNRREIKAAWVEQNSGRLADLVNDLSLPKRDLIARSSTIIGQGLAMLSEQWIDNLDKRRKDRIVSEIIWKRRGLMISILLALGDMVPLLTDFTNWKEATKGQQRKGRELGRTECAVSYVGAIIPGIPVTPLRGIIRSFKVGVETGAARYAAKRNARRNRS